MRDVCHKSFYDGAELGHFLPYTDYPVIRAQVIRPKNPNWADSMLYDIVSDYGQATNLTGSPIEDRYQRLLVQIMREMDAPPSQFERLGLDPDRDHPPGQLFLNPSREET